MVSFLGGFKHTHFVFKVAICLFFVTVLLPHTEQCYFLLFNLKVYPQVNLPPLMIEQIEGSEVGTKIRMNIMIFLYAMSLC